MNITQLERFVAVVDAGMHAPRAAEALGIPLASLYTSIDKLEAAVNRAHVIMDAERGVN